MARTLAMFGIVALISAIALLPVHAEVGDETKLRLKEADLISKASKELNDQKDTLEKLEKRILVVEPLTPVERSKPEAERKKLEQERRKQAEEKQKNDIETQRNRIKEAEKDLEITIRAFAFKGSTARAVTKATELLNQKAELDILTDRISKAGHETQQILQRDLSSKESNLDKTVNEAKDRTEQEILKDLADSRFAGFGFGVAIGAIIKAGKRDLVQSATLDANRIVRIDRDNNTTANFLLESHYFFTPNANFLPWFPMFNVPAEKWGHGPFVAVQPGTQNIIEAVGIGWMLGFKRSHIIASDLARDRGDSFNLGAGILVNPNSQVLGDGITKNQPLPTGETDIRLKRTTEIGWLITFSYSF